MFRFSYRNIFALFLLTISAPLFAQDVIELDTTTIKGNTELPKFLYVVPWQDKTRENTDEQKLVLHNLYADLFDPVMPKHIPADQFELALPKEKTPN